LGAPLSPSSSFSYGRTEVQYLHSPLAVDENIVRLQVASIAKAAKFDFECRKGKGV
jgi:hypothetical protein